MIAKEITKTTNSGGIRRLIEYIGRLDRDENEKVELTFTNCLSNKTAIYEMETKQHLSRGRQNKTYHLVLSFHKEDNLTKEQFSYIEDEVCKILGYADHQRGSAVHMDTNNPHLHIAINKVNPETLRVVTPYYSYYKLNAFCRKMQVELNLKQDDLTFKHERGAYKFKNIETLNKESLYSFISENIKTKEFLENKPKTWQELHLKLKKFNLVIKPFKNGFVIGDVLKNIWVKASFLMSCKTLGEFEEYKTQSINTSLDINETKKENFDNQFTSTKKQKNKNTEDLNNNKSNQNNGNQYKFYDGVNSKTSQSSLWIDFLAEKNRILNSKNMYLSNLKDSVQHQREVLQRRYLERRQNIKNHKYMNGQTKLYLYKKLAQNRRNEAAKITAQYAFMRKEAYEHYKMPQWQDKLISEAYKGNIEALQILMYSKQQKGFNLLLKMLEQNKDEIASKKCLDNIKHLQAKKSNKSIPAEIKEWIDKRNSLVGKVHDMPNHKVLTNEQGCFKYRGCRQIANYKIVLLEKDKEIFIRLISDKQKGLLSSNLNLGDTVNINEKGLIQINLNRSNKTTKRSKIK